MPQVAPGIHRIGNGLINAYLLEESGEVTIIDAGLPGYWRRLPTELAALGPGVPQLERERVPMSRSVRAGGIDQPAAVAAST